jgi:glyoxylase-like metal-dependent hydrolase (beta-lactamase superfamily II)
MGLRRLSDRISYLPASEDPLSADVGIIHGERYEWIFDVGNNDEAAEMIGSIGRDKKIVLSHFHVDHAGNIKRTDCRDIYCGDYTYARLQMGTEIKAPVTYYDGPEITVFPIPSTHSRGAVGLEVDGEYAFIGDVVYGAEKHGREAYNVNLLKDMTVLLENLKAGTLLLSHDPSFARPKAEVVSKLKELYAMRSPGEAYIYKD